MESYMYCKFKGKDVSIDDNIFKKYIFCDIFNVHKKETFYILITNTILSNINRYIKKIKVLEFAICENPLDYLFIYKNSKQFVIKNIQNTEIPLLFRNNISESNLSNKFFITIPHYSTNLNLLIDENEKYFNYFDLRILGQLWCREKHSFNGYHIHGIISFNSQYRIQINNYTTIILSKIRDNLTDNEYINPNIQVVKSEKRVKEYILQDYNEDNLYTHINGISHINYVSKGSYTIDKIKKPNDFLKRMYDEMIYNKKNYKDLLLDKNIDNEDKINLIRNCKLLESIEKYIDKTKKKKTFIIPNKPNDIILDNIWNWLNDLALGNLKKPDKDPRHIYICGNTKTGKSSLAKYLQSCFKVYILDNSAWFNQYNDDFDLCLYDEFTPHTQKLICDLNRFLRGNFEETFQIKNGTIIKTNPYIPCIFISNYSFEYIKNYFKTPDIDAFFQRFCYVNIKDTKLPIDMRDYNYSYSKSIGIQCNFKYNIFETSIYISGNKITFKINSRYKLTIDIEIGEYNEETLLTDKIYFILPSLYYHINEIQNDTNNKGCSALISNNKDLLYKYNNRYIKITELISNDSIYMKLTTQLISILKNMGIYIKGTYSEIYPNKYLSYSHEKINECFCFEDKNDYIILPCLHTFHDSCMKLYGKYICPLCRRISNLFNDEIPIIKNIHDIYVNNKISRIYYKKNCENKDLFEKIYGLGICNCLGCIN